MVLAFSSLTLVSCGDDDDEPKGDDPTEETDALSNTTWRGTVDDVTVTLSFKTNGKVSENALGDISDGTYSISGNKLTLDFDDSFLVNSYGSRYKFTQTSSKLVLENDMNDKLTFRSW